MENSKYIFYTFFFFIAISVNAQKYDNIWILGYGGIQTTDTTIRMSCLRFNPIRSIDTILGGYSMYFTNTSISDPSTGDLQFYTNGISIRDKTHQIMQSGDSINYGTNTWINTRAGGYRALQGVLALPFPNHPNQYYLFHQRMKSGVTFFNNVPIDFLYSKIDLSLNNGKGKVIQKNQVLLSDTLSSFVTACQHGNGRDWWIIQQDIHTHKFYFYLLSPLGIQLHHTQTMGNANYQTRGNVSGYFSPNGKKFAVFNQEAGVYIYDFDRCNGLLNSNTLIPFNYTISPGLAFVNIQFSPNSELLYFSNLYNLTQYNLTVSNIPASADTVATYDSFVEGNAQTNFLTMQLAPDNKIYINSLGANSYLHVIDSPDMLGTGCNVLQHSIRLKGYNNSIPNFPNYRLGAFTGSGCDTLNVATEQAIEHRQIKVFPNPTNDILNIEISENIKGKYYLYNTVGQVIQETNISTPQIQISTHNFANGIYFLSVVDANGRLVGRKRVVVQHE